MDEVISNLWVGNKEDAEQTTDMIMIGVGDYSRVWDNYYIPILGEDELNARVLNSLLEIIDYFMERGDKVLVYCEEGIDRSPYVAAQYILGYFFEDEETLGDAYSIVKRSHKETIEHYEWENI